jgi:hypothetical protein
MRMLRLLEVERPSSSYQYFRAAHNRSLVSRVTCHHWSYHLRGVVPRYIWYVLWVTYQSIVVSPTCAEHATLRHLASHLGGVPDWIVKVSRLKLTLIYPCRRSGRFTTLGTRRIGTRLACGERTTDSIWAHPNTSPQQVADRCYAWCLLIGLF